MRSRVLKYADDLALIASRQKYSLRRGKLPRNFREVRLFAVEERKDADRCRAEICKDLMIDCSAVSQLGSRRQDRQSRSRPSAALEKCFEQKLLLEFILRAAYQHQRARLCGRASFFCHVRSHCYQVKNPKACYFT